jgi:hypothetical protein
LSSGNSSSLTQAWYQIAVIVHFYPSLNRVAVLLDQLYRSQVKLKLLADVFRSALSPTLWTTCWVMGTAAPGWSSGQVHQVYEWAEWESIQWGGCPLWCHLLMVSLVVNHQCEAEGKDELEAGHGPRYWWVYELSWPFLTDRRRCPSTLWHQSLIEFVYYFLTRAYLVALWVSSINMIIIGLNKNQDNLDGLNIKMKCPAYIAIPYTDRLKWFLP